MTTDYIANVTITQQPGGDLYRTADAAVAAARALGQAVCLVHRDGRRVYVTRHMDANEAVLALNLILA